MGIVDKLGDRTVAWAKSRRGIATWGSAAFLSPISVHRPADLVTLPFMFLIVLALTGAFVWYFAQIWESKTRPGVFAFARTRQYSTQSRQFRADANARFFADRGGFLFERRYFFTATGLPPVRLTSDFYQRLQVRARLAPAKVVSDGVRTWWQFEGGFWWENAGYSPQDVLALLKERERRQKRDLERAHMLLNAEAAPTNVRGPINREMRQAVFARDGGRCQECSSTFDLQYDHIIPVALGGATTVENLQLLCSYCNQAKGASI